MNDVDWMAVITTATSVIGTFSLVAAMTPNKWDNKIAQVLMICIRALALNVGHAKPEDKK